MGRYTLEQKSKAIAAEKALNSACYAELSKYTWWECLFDERKRKIRQKLKSAIKRNKRDLNDVLRN